MARKPIFKKRKKTPWRIILSLAHKLAFGTTGLNFFQLSAEKETSRVIFP